MTLTIDGSSEMSWPRSWTVFTVYAVLEYFVNHRLAKDLVIKDAENRWSSDSDDKVYAGGV